MITDAAEPCTATATLSYTPTPWAPSAEGTQVGAGAHVLIGLLGHAGSSSCGLAPHTAYAHLPAVVLCVLFTVQELVCSGGAGNVYFAGDTVYCGGTYTLHPE